MAIKNLDEATNVELRTNLMEAIKSNDEEKITTSFLRMAEDIQSNLLKEARSIANIESADRAILDKRGMPQLTSEERAYYSQVIEKRGFTDLEITMPRTIFDRVFDDLEQNHPLLSAITFENTTGVTEWVIRKTGTEAAWWGQLTDPIKKELEGGFAKINTVAYKLSSYLPVAKSMLDLGAEWLDRYVRVVLTESISLGLEMGIVAGTGKDQPIGMMKDLKGSVVEGVYPDKTAKPLADFKPNTLGTEIMAPLTNGGKRTVTSVIMLVNPVDYWAKIFGATTMLTSNGAYVYGVLPIPGNIIQTVAVPKNKLIVGVAKDYFMGIGSAGKIEYSDEYKFLEDVRVYLAKQYATGTPKDNFSFLVFDIENLDTTLATEINSNTKTSATRAK
ncbi:TPA: phage major capsid protein [Clostridioides difficile]|uniref:major head protein n=1 Tax=Clostridium phage phiCD6356 TaxID=864178 RepID=UPI0001DE0235|nr:phage major capsid protein [Clostridioides difficile]YP_004306106.1 major head protein [Clostridium phage phiCD6356]ADK37867.1 putative major capsid protein A [Clostridium phage phiCD6356]EGT3662972.1 phage major capsid protein [Clostridioides difficile]EGT5247467.1 phage major capsid protein [Clostridioides difficile]EGT5415041.1 phage major capsid protein [Clostridioides difficile]EGT5490353.1 phage major capsid protein [Clostridioides difficile]